MGSSEILVQMFKCCVTDEQSAGAASANAANRRRIDRSMIGSPTDFRHTAHIGSTDVAGGGGGGVSTPGGGGGGGGGGGDFAQLQNQMRSKGGYQVNGVDARSTPLIRSSLVMNARSLDEVRRQ